MSTTMDPEYDEFRKGTSTNEVPITLKVLLQGNCSKKTNRATDTSCCTISPIDATPWLIISSKAELPKNVIHMRVKPEVTSNTPSTNSRMVRPREIRAMNKPTKGAQLSHQPQ